MSRIAVVTDSSATLSAATAERLGVTVVPLQVVIGATAYDEGAAGGATPDMVADALREFVPVSTSRPSPAAFEEAYAALDCDAILSIHLSGEMSGTVESAQVAARRAGVPVRVVDTRQVGAATGFAVSAAVSAVAEGVDLDAAATVAADRAGAATSLFYVDTLEYLRRGGRVGAAAALLGGALSVKPLLTIRDGRVTTLEKVRTAGRALARLEELAVEAAGTGPVEVAVTHLASPDRARKLADSLGARLGDQLEGREVGCGELGAALGAHVGPGMVSVAVAPLAVHSG